MALFPFVPVISYLKIIPDERLGRKRFIFLSKGEKPLVNEAPVVFVS
jgi:hypothetical protein